MPLELQVVLASHLASGSLTALLAGLLWWFGKEPGEKQYRIWADAWFAFALYSFAGGAAFTMGVMWPHVVVFRLPLSMLTQASHTAGSALLVLGTVAFLSDSGARRRDVAVVLAFSLALGGAMALGNATGAPGWVRPLYRSALAGSALFCSAILLLRRVNHPTAATRLLAGVMIGLGLVHLHYVVYWLARAGGLPMDYSLALWSLVELPLVAAVVATMAAMALSDQRLRSRQALLEKDRHHRDILDRVASGVLISKEGRFAYANPALARMFGYDADDLMGERPRWSSTRTTVLSSSKHGGVRSPEGWTS